MLQFPYLNIVHKHIYHTESDNKKCKSKCVMRIFLNVPILNYITKSFWRYFFRYQSKKREKELFTFNRIVEFLDEENCSPSVDGNTVLFSFNNRKFSLTVKNYIPNCNISSTWKYSTDDYEYKDLKNNRKIIADIVHFEDTFTCNSIADFTKYMNREFAYYDEETGQDLTKQELFDEYNKPYTY